MALDALLFDLDGTLLDTNAVHVEAWRRAFEQHGFVVASDRIAPEIAHDGTEIVASILGRSIAEENGEDIKKSVGKNVQKVIAERAPLPVFEGARELFSALKKRGLKTAIATAAGDDILDALIEGSGLDVRELADVVTTKDDADEGKPAPEILLAACEKLNLAPGQCAFVGDTKWDAVSARKAGLAAVGVLDGSAFSAEELSRAGMRLTFPTVQEVLENLDAVLEKCSPGVLRLSSEVAENLMRHALEAARDGVRDGGVPIGAVLARPTDESDFEVIARGFNTVHRDGDKTAHAEIVTFRHAAGKIPTDAKDVILVSSLEPCVMCLGAACEAAIDTIVYGLEAPADNGTSRLSAPQSPEAMMPRIIGNVLAAESRALFEEWMKTNAGSEQAPFVRQLLELTN
jgi:HAD superfamily hydrolase (TIGR01509 family)